MPGPSRGRVGSQQTNGINWNVETDLASNLSAVAEERNISLCLVATDAVFSGPRLFHEENARPTGMTPLAVAAREAERRLENTVHSSSARTLTVGVQTRQAQHCWKISGSNWRIANARSAMADITQPRFWPAISPNYWYSPTSDSFTACITLLALSARTGYGLSTNWRPPAAVRSTTARRWQPAMLPTARRSKLHSIPSRSPRSGIAHATVARRTRTFGSTSASTGTSIACDRPTQGPPAVMRRNKAHPVVERRPEETTKKAGMASSWFRSAGHSLVRGHAQPIPSRW